MMGISNLCNKKSKWMKSEKNIPSEFLKDCMADAVIRLLEKYPLNEIQVKQICDVSGYHRSSWFRAFRSKHESVTYKMIRQWQVWAEVHGVTIRDEFSLDNADAFFQYNYEIRDMTRLLYRRGLMDDISKSFTAILYAHHCEEPHEAYKASFFAYSLYGILLEWIVRDFKESPAEMADIIREVFS